MGISKIRNLFTNKKTGQRLPATLQSCQYPFSKPKKMSKPSPVTILTTSLLVTLFCRPLAALDIDQISETELKEKWGQVIFCQSIYKMPEVKPRLYSFDLEQCDSAGKLALELVAKYPPDKQRTLKNQAEQHARALSLNTNEPYHAVGACREYCQKVAERLDER